MQISLNENIADDFILQQIDLEKYKINLRNKSRDSLDILESQIVSIVSEKDPTKSRSKAIDALEKIPEVISNHYKEERKDHEAELLLLLLYLRKRPKQIFEKNLGFSLLNIVLSKVEISSILSNLLVEGAPLRDWWQRHPDLLEHRVSDEIRKGVAQQKDLPSLIASIRGTKENNFTDGVIKKTYSEAESIIVTSVQKAANDTLIATYNLNREVIKSVQQKSTLDARTTDICKAYSGLTWSIPDYTPIDHNLPFLGGPPRHWRCRSILVPITKSFSELSSSTLFSPNQNKVDGIQSLMKKELRKRGFSPDEIKSILVDTQASMDGQVSKDLNYEEWLRTKSTSFQKKVLGEKKYDLWIKKKISFKDLVDQSGDPLTVQELIKKHK